MGTRREGVQPSDFYRSDGWLKRGEHSFDALINENLTTTSQKYVSRVRKRIGSIVTRGNRVLDIGSGPIQYQEYLEISRGFEERICVDFSEVALEEALARLAEDGQQGVALCGDYLETDLSHFGGFDLIICINVLYHMPVSNQFAAVRKALSELSPEGRLVIVYSNPRSPFNLLLRSGSRVKRHLRSMRLIRANPAPTILFEPIPLSSWSSFQDEAKIAVSAWRTLPPRIEQFLARPKFLGETILNLCYLLERLPLWERLSSYVIITLTRK